MNVFRVMDNLNTLIFVHHKTSTYDEINLKQILFFYLKREEYNYIFLKNVELDIPFTVSCLFWEQVKLSVCSLVQGGIYVLQIMDWYCASFSLMLISLTECVAIAWIYGKFKSCQKDLNHCQNSQILFMKIRKKPWLNGIYKLAQLVSSSLTKNIKVIADIYTV